MTSPINLQSINISASLWCIHAGRLISQIKLSALPGCYPTDLGNMDEWLVRARRGLVMEDDVMMLGITLFVCLIVPTDKPSTQTLIHKISAITVCTLDSCLTANAAKPAGLSRKQRWHTQGSSTRQYYPLFLAVLPCAFISQKTKKCKTASALIRLWRWKRDEWDLGW